MKLSIDIGSTLTDYVIVEGKEIVKSDSFLSKDFSLNKINFENVDEIYATGCGAADMPNKINGIVVKKVNEIDAIYTGGINVGSTNALIVNVGSGTCMVDEGKHIGGTSIGGATLLGLGKLLLGKSDLFELEELAAKGNLDNVDLTLKKIYPEGIGLLPSSATAAHFGDLHDYNEQDIALALFNLVAQAIGSIALFAAKSCKKNKIILTGGLTKSKIFQEIIQGRICTLSDIEVIIPKNAHLATALGGIQ